MKNWYGSQQVYWCIQPLWTWEWQKRPWAILRQQTLKMTRKVRDKKYFAYCNHFTGTYTMGNHNIYSIFLYKQSSDSKHEWKHNVYSVKTNWMLNQLWDNLRTMCVCCPFSCEKRSIESKNRWRVLGLSHQLTVLLQAQYFHSIKKTTQQKEQQQTSRCSYWTFHVT